MNRYFEKTFDSIRHFTEDGIEFWYARELQNVLEYSKWDNFKNVIEKAKQLIDNGLSLGEIFTTDREVNIGSGATRRIIDYKLDRSAVVLINKLAYNKLNKEPFARNETMILSLIEKYCVAKGIKYEFQFYLDGYIFDSCIGNKILLEFDEQHHENSKQRFIDKKKTKIAWRYDYELLRFDVFHDIVDIILAIEKLCYLEPNLILRERNTSYQLKGFFPSEASYNASCKGLYGGLSRKELRLRKGKNIDIDEYMGSTELAANLFVATQATEKIGTARYNFQDDELHFETGSIVRASIKNLGNSMPEELPLKNLNDKKGR